VRPAEAIGDVDLDRREHRFAGRDRLPVEQDLGERRDAAEAQDDRFSGLGWRRVEARPEPPIAVVEIVRLRPTGIPERPSDRAGHRRGHPLEGARRTSARRGPGQFPAPVDRAHVETHEAR
jgi:hypothetical protein